MIRLVAAVAAVALLVGGGFWVASLFDGEALQAAATAVGGAVEDVDRMGSASDANASAGAGDASAAPSDADAADPGDAGAAPDDGDDASASASADEAPSESGTDAGSAPDFGELGDGFEAVAPRVEERRISFEGSEPVLEDGVDYAAVIDTSAGTMVVDLYESRTPSTVNNFVFLALHKYYDGIVFHRVLEDFMAQTGDPTGTGRGGPGYTFEDEIDPSLGHDGPGILSMANSGPDTNGSQFFLTFTATPWLDGNHAVFGRIVEGLEVLDDLTRIDPQQPQAVAQLDDPVETLREQGLEIEGRGTVSELLQDRLGALPVAGQSFTLDPYRGAFGSVGGEPAIGLWPQPDRIESVTIYRRPR